MSVRSAQSVTVDFATARFDTGAATNGDSLPTGTLVVNGTDNAASVTVTNVGTGYYKAAVTLPTLAVGDIVQIRIAATVNSVAGVGVVWTDTKDVVFDSAGLVDATAVKLGPSGSATAQTARDIGQGIPNAVAGASGGLLIAGSNAATTFAGASFTGSTFAGVINVSASTWTGTLSTVTLAASQSNVTFAGTLATFSGLLSNTTTMAGAISGVSLAASQSAVTFAGLVSNTTTMAGAISGVALAASQGAVTFSGLLSNTSTIAGAISGVSLAASQGAVTFSGLLSNTTTMAGAITAASVTGNVGGNVVGSVASVTGLTASDVGAIKAKTDHLPSSDIVHTSGKLWALDGSGNAIAPASATTALAATLAAGITLDGTQTFDGVSVTKILTALVAQMCGKLTVTDNGSDRTYAFKKQDGTTTSISVTVAEADGARASSGSIS